MCAKCDEEKMLCPTVGTTVETIIPAIGYWRSGKDRYVERIRNVCVANGLPVENSQRVGCVVEVYSKICSVFIFYSSIWTGWLKVRCLIRLSFNQNVCFVIDLSVVSISSRVLMVLELALGVGAWTRLIPSSVPSLGLFRIEVLEPTVTVNAWKVIKVRMLRVFGNWSLEICFLICVLSSVFI